MLLRNPKAGWLLVGAITIVCLVVLGTLMSKHERRETIADRSPQYQQRPVDDLQKGHDTAPPLPQTKAQDAPEALEEQTLRAYTSVLGDAKQAQVQFNKARQVAMLTEFQLGDVVRAQRLLLGAGFRGLEIDKAILASVDVAASQPPDERVGVLAKTSIALARVSSTGKLHYQEVASLSEVGVSQEAVLKHLNLGSVVAAQRAIDAGKVNAKAGVSAIELAILQELGTGKLGEFSSSATHRAQWREIARHRATVDAANLWQAYQENAVAADAVYKNKPILIAGTVESIDAEPNGNPVLALHTPNRFLPIRAKIRAGSTEWAAALSRGTRVNLSCEICYGRVAGSPVLGLCTPQD